MYEFDNQLDQEIADFTSYRIPRLGHPTYAISLMPVLPVI